MSRKRLLKRMYGLIPFYTDTDNRFEFYYRKNWMDQFDVLVHDVQNNSGRWFMVTAPVFFTLVGVVKDGEIHAYKANISQGAKPRVVNDWLHNKHFKLIAHKVAKLNAESVVAKLGEFGPEDNRQKVLLLKRVASVPEQDFTVLGMDTIELPVEGIKNLVEDIQKRYFKGVELDIEMEEKDATN